MTSMQYEKELKFDGATDVELPSLEGLPGVAAVAAATPEDLDAVYYDTSDLRLLAHGITLRRRTGGHDAGWHLKLPAGGPDTRLELHHPLDPEPPAAPPQAAPEPPLPDRGSPAPPTELTLRVRAYLRDAPLGPVVDLRTHRRRTLLLDRRQRPLVEVARDAVTARRTGEATAAAWTEVEAELLRGDPALLDAVAQRLTRGGLRRSASPSKLARALSTAAVRTPPPPPAPIGDPIADPIGAAVTALLRTQVAALLALDHRVRTDQPDAVHRMRVTVRRLRSALKTHRALFRTSAGPGLVGLGEELRRFAAVLGAARDREVLGAALTDEIEGLAPEECPGPVRERVTAWAGARYQESWTGVVAELDSAGYFALLDALERLVAAPPLRRRAAARPAGPAFERRLAAEQGRVRRLLAAAAGTEPGPERDTALHGARKAAKRARYAGEGARPVLGGSAQRFTRRMTSIQELLGTRQDAVLACRELPGLAAEAHAAGEPGFGYGILYAGRRAVVRRCDAELAERLPALLAELESTPVQRPAAE
ncbi:CYTH and CHAD domain-containing protein [Streptacidiphilus albus]|uniref:CYTH and CHAD domain-containing protein n=1 Tax=Streptacidiphilus albus TaxID=105425 RepID=UPI0005A9C90B|nr:CYTH and CHAD domain-containing protein [Streptacidiphilus albus]